MNNSGKVDIFHKLPLGKSTISEHYFDIRFSTLGQ